MSKELELIAMFGKTYAQLDANDMDELCIWMREMGEKFYKEGRAVFEPEVLDLTSK